MAYARGQIDAIARAQKNGDLPAHLHPGFVLGFVLHLATGWVSVSPQYEAAIDVPRPRSAPARSRTPCAPFSPRPRARPDTVARSGLSGAKSADGR